MYVLANLDSDTLERIQKFERDSGLRLLALRDVDLEPAAIAADSLAEVKKLEEELGICLVAVR
jgi:hypothetical protein